MTYLLADYNHSTSSTRKIMAFLRKVKPKRVAVEASAQSRTEWTLMSKILRSEGMRFFRIDSLAGTFHGNRLSNSYMDKVGEGKTARENTSNAFKAFYLRTKISDARTRFMIHRLEELKKEGKFPDVIVVGASHAKDIRKRFKVKLVRINWSLKNPLWHAFGKAVQFFGDRKRKKSKAEKRKQILQRRK